MPSFNVDIEFEVFCACGAGLCNKSSTGAKSGYRGNSLYVTVEPCERCKSLAHDDGYEKGYAEGSKESDNG